MSASCRYNRKCNGTWGKSAICRVYTKSDMWQQCVDNSTMNFHLRIARGPSVDGVWRTRRVVVSDRLQYEVQQHQQMIDDTMAWIAKTQKIHEAMMASIHAATLADTIRSSLRFVPEPATEPEPYIDIFTPEEIEMELQWIDPLVCFHDEDITASGPILSSGFL